MLHRLAPAIFVGVVVACCGAAGAVAAVWWVRGTWLNVKDSLREID